jgi:hypothetical protein
MVKIPGFRLGIYVFSEAYNIYKQDLEITA